MMSVSVFSTGVIFLLFVGLGWPAMVDGSHSISYDDDDIDDGYYIDDVFINSISVTRRWLTYGTTFNCGVKKPKKTTKDVNKLSPFDVEVVAALGDSHTAGFGAGALLSKSRPEYKGLSWSIGGKSSLSTVTTLPNILKEFNPKLYGFSKRRTKFKKKEAFNRAVSGARVRDLLRQATDLVSKINRKKKMSKWKVITIFIGSNDLCAKSTCKNSVSKTVENFMSDLHKALQYLSENVKKAFINLALLLDVSILAPLKGGICDKVHRKFCPCATGKNKKKSSQVAQEINSEIIKHYQDHSPFDRKDFAVVVQPLYSKTTKLPYKRFWKKRVPDKSFLSTDCFHVAQKTHSLAATLLWNNMLQPVGKKTDFIEWRKKRKLICPSNKFPYFRTNMNSKWAV